jgi:DNA-binding MarR family transcriptional regulator
MEKDGLLVRRHADMDRRTVYVSITTSGRDLFTHMARDHQNWITEMLSGLPPTQQKQLNALLLELQVALSSRPSTHKGTS